MKVYNKINKKSIHDYMYYNYGTIEYWNFMRAIETLNNINFINSELWQYILELDYHLHNSRE